MDVRQDSADCVRLQATQLTCAMGTNPAWGFESVVPNYEVRRQDQLRGRLLLKRFEAGDEVEREYERWSASRMRARPNAQ